MWDIGAYLLFHVGHVVRNVLMICMGGEYISNWVFFSFNYLISCTNDKAQLVSNQSTKATFSVDFNVTLPSRCHIYLQNQAYRQVSQRYRQCSSEELSQPRTW